MKRQDKYIAILHKQIELLTSDDFDLEAWKKGTIIRLSSIYAADDSRIIQIHNLKVDYSSWTLRDSSPSYKPIETCKKMGKAILEAIIDEISIFGFKSISESKDLSPIYALLPEEIQSKFEKLSKNPSDSEFKKLLQTLEKKKLAQMIQLLMKNEDQ